MNYIILLSIVLHQAILIYCLPADITCQLQYSAGPCYAYVNRWYFDQQEKACKTFVWGGCRGNGNNFKTRIQCEKKCAVEKEVVTQGTPKKCLLPRVSGPCDGNVTRWYFNHQNKKCESFTWGGCKANKNNFISQDECKKNCHGKIGQVRQNKDEVLSGVQNKDDSKKCNLSADSGPCYAYITRWYYNAQEKKCQNFTWGGCKGNRNNFLTKFECEMECSKEKGVVDKEEPVTGIDTSCKLRLVKGKCIPFAPRSYYDRISKKCKSSLYGGCDGFGNYFQVDCDVECVEEEDEDEEEHVNP